MNGNSERGRDGEETNDQQGRERVADRAAARRKRMGYDKHTTEGETSPGAWFDAGDVTPSGLSASAHGAGGVWRFDANTFRSRSVGIFYKSTEVYLATDGRQGETRAGSGVSLPPAEARELGRELFDATERGKEAAGEGVSATLPPGSASVSGRAPGLSWAVEGDDTDTTLSVALDGDEVRLSVEAVNANAEAGLVVALSLAEVEELGAAIYQAGEDAEVLAELDDVDGNAAEGGA